MKPTWRNIILIPFSALYGSIVAVRNWMYDRGIAHSTSFSTPLISVGNLAIGGTGKTPHVEYVLQLLKPQFKTAMLSRGYKRKTRGYILADEKASSTRIGDEPYQVYLKNKDTIVAVDENRVRGVKNLLKQFPQINAIVLDDAFQHRRINAGLSLLLTDYANLYTHDSILPGGNLRESKHGFKRADIILVTKCPDDISDIGIRLLEKEFVVLPHQHLFFSTFEYGNLQPVFAYQSAEDSEAEIADEITSVLIVSGIANPATMIEKLSGIYQNIDTLSFPDHYNFKPSDYKLIENTFKKINHPRKIIVTTEKDAARFVSDKNFPAELKQYLFALPIKVKILNQQENIFKNKILNYVTENSRNS